MMTMMNMISMVKNFAKGFVKKEEGQGMVEYGLIIALIAIVVIAALILVGDELFVIFNSIADSLKPTP